MLTIGDAISSGQVEQARGLFQEYAASLGIDLCFQGFEQELANLPAMYSPPKGRLLLAWNDTEPAGCIALRPWEPGVCEMKRLYVRPRFRGTGLGRMLVERIISEARDAGYDRMRLDSLSSMLPAITLYRQLGFRDIPSYQDNPVEGTVFLELPLNPVHSDS
jgi:putative acetyltransferase